jgi:hypothetical protein
MTSIMLSIVYLTKPDASVIAFLLLLSHQTFCQPIVRVIEQIDCSLHGSSRASTFMINVNKY